MSRESVAITELNEAEMRLKNAQNEILKATGDLTKYSSDIIKLYGDTPIERLAGGIFGIVSGTFVDLTKNEDYFRALMNAGIDIATGVFFKSTPIGWVAGYIVGDTIKDLANSIYDWIANKTTNVPEITPNGYIRITMPNGEVYSRPIQDPILKKIYGEAKGGSLFGGTKDDVLFGENGNDEFYGSGEEFSERRDITELQNSRDFSEILRSRCSL